MLANIRDVAAVSIPASRIPGTVITTNKSIEAALGEQMGGKFIEFKFATKLPNKDASLKERTGELACLKCGHSFVELNRSVDPWGGAVVAGALDDEEDDLMA
jgi:hypothetical protein